MTLEDDLKAIKEAENLAESSLEETKKQAEAIKRDTKSTAKKEEEKALDAIREEMAAKEKGLVKKAQLEGEQIIKDASATVEKLKVQAGRNKQAAADYLIKEILES